MTSHVESRLNAWLAAKPGRAVEKECRLAPYFGTDRIQIRLCVRDTSANHHYEVVESSQEAAAAKCLIVVEAWIAAERVS